MDFFDRLTVAATTIWSGFSYVFSKDAVKFVGKTNSSSRKSN